MINSDMNNITVFISVKHGKRSLNLFKFGERFFDASRHQQNTHTRTQLLKA